MRAGWAPATPGVDLRFHKVDMPRQSSPSGSRTRLSTVRGWRPEPIDHRAERLLLLISFHQCAGQELNLQSQRRVGYSHLGSPVPGRRDGFSLFSPAPPTGLEPAASTLTGWRALRAAPQGHSSTDFQLKTRDGSGGIRTLSISRSEREWSAGCLPSRFELDLSSGGWNRTSGLHVQSVASRPTATAPELDIAEFGKEDSNLHRPIQSQGACR